MFLIYLRLLIILNLIPYIYRNYSHYKVQHVALVHPVQTVKQQQQHSGEGIKVVNLFAMPVDFTINYIMWVLNGYAVHIKRFFDAYYNVIFFIRKLYAFTTKINSHAMSEYVCLCYNLYYKKFFFSKSSAAAIKEKVLIAYIIEGAK